LKEGLVGRLHLYDMVCRWDSCRPIMLTSDPSTVQPSTVSPKAPSLSLSSAETLTPESGAGGRPSRASVSAVDTVTSESRPIGTASPASRAGLDVTDRPPVVGKVSLANSSSAATLVDGSARQSGMRRCDPACRRHSGELRRRKYAALTTPEPMSLQLSRQQTNNSAPGIQEVQTTRSKYGGSPPQEHQARSVSTACSGGGAESDDCEVLIEGPLQQRHLLVFWRWRWCVLDRRELRVYWNEEASLLMPEKPLERRSVASLTVGPDLNFPSVLICADSRTREPLSFLRAGPGLRWEEVAASTLWLGAFAAVSRSASRQRANRLARGAAERSGGVAR